MCRTGVRGEGRLLSAPAGEQSCWEHSAPRGTGGLRRRCCYRLCLPAPLSPSSAQKCLSLPCPVSSATRREQLKPVLALRETSRLRGRRPPVIPLVIITSGHTSGPPWRGPCAPRMSLLPGAVYFTLLKRAWLLKTPGQILPQEKPPSAARGSGLKMYIENE